MLSTVLAPHLLRTSVAPLTAAVLPSIVAAFSSAPAAGPVKKTVLNEFHRSIGGKMVEFCGWDMPVQYKDTILNSVKHTRSSAALFDVSHMCQLTITGRDRVAFIESLVVGDIRTLPENSARLTMFTDENGGILDDLMVTNSGDHLYVVVNAGRRDHDVPHLLDHAALARAGPTPLDVQVTEIHDRSLLALQGPRAESILASLVASPADADRLRSLRFMNGGWFALPDSVGGLCRVNRSGYTGEDGFEISVPSTHAVTLARAILADPAAAPAGLGARDVLRLEAGLCLYGHDITTATNPVDARLMWTISQRRREQGGFPGHAAIMAALKRNEGRRRVGILFSGPPVREGTEILDQTQSKKIGVVTSGSFSPILNKPISMGYVDVSHANAGVPVVANVRNKVYEGLITKMPFVPTTYKN